MDKQSRRRIDILRRRGLFGSLDGVDIGVAVTPKVVTTAWRMLHDTFVQLGYIEPRDDGLYTPEQDVLTLVAVEGDNVVGTQGLVIDADGGLPADTRFSLDVDHLRSMNRYLCESGRQAVVQAHRTTSVSTELMRASYALATKEGCSDMLLVVRPGHAPLYEALGFAEEARCEAVPSDPLELLRIDFDAVIPKLADGDEGDAFLASYFVENNPYMDGVAAL